LLVALFAIPLLIQGLGTDRFGVLTLVWMLIGYFGLFDLGIGRALTQLVSGMLEGDRAGQIPRLTWTGLALMLVFGAVGSVLLASVTPWLVGGALNIPPSLRAESLTAFYVLAASLPLVITTSGFRGVLEAYQRFDLINAIRVPMGVFTFAGPLLVLPFSNSLAPIVVVLVFGRAVAWAAHVFCCLHAVPGLRSRPGFDRESIAPLARFGGWMTVSNLASPVMVYFDRFLVAALLSVGAVAYYVTPYEVVTKLWLVPGALLAVLFPAFAATSMRDNRQLALLTSRAIHIIFLVLFPVILILITWAPELMHAWLGPEFSRQSAPVLRWLAFGVFINSLAQVPFTVLQGMGRPDLTAKLHLCELPLYGLIAWWLVRTMGIEGAAIAWVGRATIDAVALSILTIRALPGGGGMTIRELAPVAASALILFLALVPQSVPAKAAFVVGTLLLFGPITWRYMLDAGERDVILVTIGRLTGRAAARS
jgi:O-antigen/teichoic acid export membrane protein